MGTIRAFFFKNRVIVFDFHRSLFIDRQTDRYTDGYRYRYRYGYTQGVPKNQANLKMFWPP